MDTNTPNTHGHADDTAGYVNPESLQRGHEEDRVDVKSIIYVPIAIVATFVLAFVVVTLIINYVRSPSKESPANPAAAKRNDAPINDRFERIDDPSGQIKQPRLEGLQRVEGTDAPYWRSMNSTKDGNPRWFHPEDMRPNSGYARELGLQDFGWVDREKKIVHMPVAEAMRLALSLKDPKNPMVDYLAATAEPIPRPDLKRLYFANPLFGATATLGHHEEKSKDHKDNKEHKNHKD